MLGDCGRHQPEARGWFKSKGTFEDLTLVECPGCPSQPWQVRDRDGHVLRFYSAERGEVFFSRVRRSRTHVLPLMTGG